MPRWEPDGVGRLQAAAFELFDEQGFERTTVAEIVGSEFQQEVVREIAAGADTLPPLDTVVRALQAASGTMFEERRAAVTRRQEIIDANPELQERELSKRAALTGAIAAALHARGLDPETALLTAGAGMLVQQTAVRRWTQPDEGRPLRELLSDALHSLRTVAAQTTDQGVVPSET